MKNKYISISYYKTIISTHEVTYFKLNDSAILGCLKSITGVAELVDANGLGPFAFSVQVRVLSPVPQAE